MLIITLLIVGIKSPIAASIILESLSLSKVAVAICCNLGGMVSTGDIIPPFFSFCRAGFLKYLGNLFVK